MTNRNSESMVMKQLVSIAIALLLLAAPGSADADPVTFTETGTGSGSLGSQDFTNALITLTATADTNDVFSTGIGASVPVSLSVNVAGIGSGTFSGNNFEAFDGYSSIWPASSKKRPAVVITSLMSPTLHSPATICEAPSDRFPVRLVSVLHNRTRLQTGPSSLIPSRPGLSRRQSVQQPSRSRRH